MIIECLTQYRQYFCHITEEPSCVILVLFSICAENQCIKSEYFNPNSFCVTHQDSNEVLLQFICLKVSVKGNTLWVNYVSLKMFLDGYIFWAYTVIHSFWLFVCLRILDPFDIFSLIWRRFYYRLMGANFDLCSALMAIGQSWFFSVPHPLWQGTSVYMVILLLSV